MQELQLLPLDQVHESATNPRQHFDDAAMADLTASIKARGVIQPILVQRRGDGYEVIAGARRLRASRAAGLVNIPAIIRSAEAEDYIFEDSLIENLQRDSMRPLEEARAFARIVGDPPKLDEVRFLGERIGKPAAYIWDRQRLVDLVSDAQQLLDRGLIPVPQALRLARLTPAQQERAIEPRADALFAADHGFSFSAEDEDDRWSGVKARSLREFEAWIAQHCRFDVRQAAEVAPLDFGPVAETVEEAAARPGRGKKVVSITYDTYVHPDAKTDERVYSGRTWKRADGTDGHPRCDRAVLGVVVTGEDRATAFAVCLHKDCEIHWGKEKREREKLAKQRQANPGAAAQQESAAEQRRRNERAKEEAERAAWERAVPAIQAATIAALKRTKPMVLAPLFDHNVDAAVRKAFAPLKTADDLVRYLALKELWYDMRDSWCGPRDFPPIAKLLGIDLKAVLAAAATKALGASMGKAEQKVKAKKSAGKKGPRRG